ncbi:Deoxyribose-phosphate aldolase 1 [Novipirellula galeiformis]|uniref:Deoxyribose-phosphate aldolase n=1 Tax=Novipirellula galeiformis TaxID=2528004 RepID=A0A5C6CKQ5_9BACT|nr:deoxyribose-phosphate aldolase [Novipirellula galeiformis]TWU25028.1 Deoxyribose-phosphate aldolase 1 [Novipirellula galeiformis]
MSSGYTYQAISKMIDHALLTPTLSTSDLETGIALALAYDVASVCIMPYAVPRCAELLSASTVKTSTVIGFPLGVNTTAVKRAEAEQAIADGCEELDMVVNLSKVISGDWDYVRQDIAAVIEVAHAAKQKVKVIFENCYLNETQKIRLCEICGQLDADWVKTSTGFGTSGATSEDLALMRQHTPEHVQVKAAGGIRDFETVVSVRELGVTRVGASRTKEILDACRLQLGMPRIDVADTGSDGY